MRPLHSACLGKLNWERRACALLLLCATTAIASPAQTFTTLYSFDGIDGSGPNGLVQAANGDLYGTTAGGGGHNAGTVFKITPSGTLTTLYSFCSESSCADGRSTFARLIQATDGNLYGTTVEGGNTKCTHGCGTVFKITTSGTLTTLYRFCSLTNCTDGENPQAGLVQAANGSFYGTTSAGGAGSACPYRTGCGTIFRITPGGNLTTLYSFCSQSDCTDGEYPQAGLVQATSGDFYGTTSDGGANGNYGTVFRITPSGTLTTLYSFCSRIGCRDGQVPDAAMILGTNNFYGITFRGGGISDCGTVFRITPSGLAFATLHSFDDSDGCGPTGLMQATDGNFYGTALVGGGGERAGTVFRMTPSGALTTLHIFDDTDGAEPYGLVQATNGDLYGTTSIGGADGFGTVFRLSAGLGPFEETQTTSGKVGEPVKILGTNLTDATSVTFNGTAAVFKVVSSSFITTTVPTGANTGFVTVTTPSGTSKSNRAFQVTP